jgi:hypothetical protein
MRIGAGTRASSWETPGAAPAYTINCGRLKQPDNQEATNQLLHWIREGRSATLRPPPRLSQIEPPSTIQLIIALFRLYLYWRTGAQTFESTCENWQRPRQWPSHQCHRLRTAGRLP